MDSVVFGTRCSSTPRPRSSGGTCFEFERVCSNTDHHGRCSEALKVVIGPMYRKSDWLEVGGPTYEWSRGGGFERFKVTTIPRISALA